MKRTGLRWSSARTRAFAIVGIFLFHLVWIVLGRGPSGRLQGLMDVAQRPSLTLSGVWERWKARRGQKVTDLRAAQAEIAQLRQQVEAFQLERQQQGPLLAEAEEAKRLLGLSQVLPLAFKPARVLANLRRAPFGGIILDQGSASGLAPDQGVLCPEGVVGRIWAVSGSQASVLPLDAYNASTAVMLGKSRATGILQGTGPHRAEIRYISRQEVVQVGEPVYTSGLDRVFPRGLLVGWVSATRPMDVELQVDVALAAPLNRLTLVAVLPPAPQLELKPPAEPPKVKGAPSTTGKGAKG